ncbi:hypothetical protein IDJ77_00815 [Mucilaginibacter sp. ZT4R22]|uniref:Immunity protein 35 of polymorphic toxin system n=1 Tax=Mucilaginibacter pankratovii TaxID=2772110 RepID=A0ABR7WJ31_9SPHI|nr:hypothetical protein [Mucilaginibacter pankratovii]MBD1362336.1 hypothetical protein [Mucilaginibacter pankratovii]
MNRIELKEELDKLSVYPGFYSLYDELLPDRIVLYHNYSKWEVFYFDERGNRNDEVVFPTEGDACNYIYGLFIRKKEIEQNPLSKIPQ